jgi:hypothetical protein
MSGGPSGAKQTGSREVMIPYESSKQNLGLFKDNDEASRFFRRNDEQKMTSYT